MVDVLPTAQLPFLNNPEVTSILHSHAFISLVNMYVSTDNI